MADRTVPLLNECLPDGRFVHRTYTGQGPSYNWWIHAQGINRDVMQADIQRYLGPEAFCMLPSEQTVSVA